MPPLFRDSGRDYYIGVVCPELREEVYIELRVAC